MRVTNKLDRWTLPTEIKESLDNDASAITNASPLFLSYAGNDCFLVHGKEGHLFSWVRSKKMSKYQMVDLDESLNPDTNGEYEEYKNLYREYEKNMLLKPWKRKSFEEWLIYDKKSDVFEKMKQDEKDGAGSGLKIGTPVLEGGIPYRYTKGFEDYALLMLARLEVRKELLSVYQGDVNYKAYPGESRIQILNNSVNYFKDNQLKDFLYFSDNNGKTGTQDIAIDRLMLEYFYIFERYGKDGRVEHTRITSNPFLDQLNRGEADYRQEYMSHGKYVPQYVTVATKSSLSGTIDWLFDVGVWGKTQYERDNDLVVPISSVAIPDTLLNQNLFLPGGLGHAVVNPLRDQSELLKRLFFNPLTGTDDNQITYSLGENQSGTISGNEMVLLPGNLGDPEGIDLNIDLPESNPSYLYLIKRDVDQNWRGMEILPMYYDSGMYKGRLHLKRDPKVKDYLLVSVNQQGTFQRGGTFTVTYNGKTDVQPDGDGKAQSGEPVLLKQSALKMVLGWINPWIVFTSLLFAAGSHWLGLSAAASFLYLSFLLVYYFNRKLDIQLIVNLWVFIPMSLYAVGDGIHVLKLVAIETLLPPDNYNAYGHSNPFQGLAVGRTGQAAAANRGAGSDPLEHFRHLVRLYRWTFNERLLFGVWRCPPDARTCWYL